MVIMEEGRRLERLGIPKPSKVPYEVTTSFVILWGNLEHSEVSPVKHTYHTSAVPRKLCQVVSKCSLFNLSSGKFSLQQSLKWNSVQSSVPSGAGHLCLPCLSAFLRGRSGPEILLAWLVSIVAEVRAQLAVSSWYK